MTATDSSPSEVHAAAFSAPSERVDGYVQLRSCATMGDGRAVALIADDAQIDWLPPGRNDSPATVD